LSALWTSDEIARATGGVANTAFEADEVSFDSREIEPGSLFVALAGEQSDGHHFLDEAFASGATGAIVSRRSDFSCVRVPDTMAALEDLGRAARARAAARICGVTGSVGKTGTKEALFAALERAFPGVVHRSVKSYNNHTGVPLSLARMPADTRFGVFEMGMNHPGELAALTRMVRPDVAIVTAIAPAHAEFFDSEEAIADAKAEIFEGLSDGGTAIIPFDSPHRDRLATAARVNGARLLTFGIGEGADVRARDFVSLPDGGSLVSVALPDAELTCTIAYSGRHWVSNALAVLAAIHALDADLAAAGLALADMEGMAGRGARRIVSLPGGEAVIVDESYNANPASMEAALAAFAGLATSGRRIAILGAMRELGAKSDLYHEALAEPILSAGIDRAILVGDGIEPLAKALGDRIEVAHVRSVGSAIPLARGSLAAGDALLVKGSNAIGLARLVEALADGEGA